MGDKRQDQAERIAARYARLVEMQAGKAVRPYRSDGYVNLMNRYGTTKDTTERYRFQPEPVIPDDLLTMYYEGNGLFAKIIDTPAEEAIKHGFSLDGLKDQEIEDFYAEALDELDWEETAMTAIRWARLFGGSIVVMLVNDGRGLEEPLDWRNIRSIDDLRVFDRSVIQPDYGSMFNYSPEDPFRTRGSRLGMPERYFVSSRYGSFIVHDSRCLVFQNGILPENTSNSIYQLWGIPEYVRIHRAIRDAEVAHGSATKLLDRSIQAVYKMKDLSAELATEEGETRVLRRLQTIDMARGLLNSITIDSEGEDYDFKTFQFSGVADVIDATCNFLSALTSIPQTILFGRSPAGMNSTGDADLENWYNFLERLQRRMIKKNLRYLLSVIFQAGVSTGEVDEVPKIKITFNPLWSLSESEQADLDAKKAQTQLTRAQTAQLYIDKQVIDPSEVRKKLADSEEFDVENMLDEYEDEDLFANIEEEGADMEPGALGAGQVASEAIQGGQIAQSGDFDKYAEGVNLEEHNTDPGTEGDASTAAPAATKLPQDMSEEEKAQAALRSPHSDESGTSTPNTRKIPNRDSVGVLVISDGKILSGTRHNDFGYGLVCGPGGHVEAGETPEQAAFRETEEEFGISPKELIPLGRGPYEPDTGLTPYLFLCTDYEGEPDCLDLEMTGAKFRTMAELDELAASMFQPFADGLEILKKCIDTALFFGDDGGEMHDELVESIGKAMSDDPENEDGGPGSGNFGHKGRPGEVGGSGESHQLGGLSNSELSSRMKDTLSKAKTGTHFSIKMNGVAGKDTLEVYKVSDGFYVRGKTGSNSVVGSADEAIEKCGIYVNDRTKDKVMYKEADIDVGDPEADESKKFASDYEAFKVAKEKLQSGDYQITEVTDEVAEKYADTLNNASKSKIAKLAEQDPQFKAVVDNISAYTQGEYALQRKAAEGILENGYDPAKDVILGDRITGSPFLYKDMYKGQNLAVSSASVTEGMANLTRAVNNSKPFDGELYRVAQDRGVIKSTDSGAQRIYVPPVAGETIRIEAPTSFSKDKDVVDKLAGSKMGDVIYYTIEPGARAVDVSKLSPYKQEELLSCGEYEVVSVDTKTLRVSRDEVGRFTPENLEVLRQTRNAEVSDGYVSYPTIETRIVLRQREMENGDSRSDAEAPYREEDFVDRMVIEDEE